MTLRIAVTNSMTNRIGTLIAVTDSMTNRIGTMIAVTDSMTPRIGTMVAAAAAAAKETNELLYHCLPTALSRTGSDLRSFSARFPGCSSRTTTPFSILSGDVRSYQVMFYQ